MLPIRAIAGALGSPHHCHFDAICIRLGQADDMIVSQALHITWGSPADGTREILGLWLSGTESAAFWPKIAVGDRWNHILKRGGKRPGCTGISGQVNRDANSNLLFFAKYAG